MGGIAVTRRERFRRSAGHLFGLALLVVALGIIAQHYAGLEWSERDRITDCATRINEAVGQQLAPMGLGPVPRWVCRCSMTNPVPSRPTFGRMWPAQAYTFAAAFPLIGFLFVLGAVLDGRPRAQGQGGTDDDH